MPVLEVSSAGVLSVIMKEGTGKGGTKEIEIKMGGDRKARITADAKTKSNMYIVLVMGDLGNLSKRKDAEGRDGGIWDRRDRWR